MERVQPRAREPDRGGLHGRAATMAAGSKTRPVQGIDSDIRLNRALWLLADGMRALKA